MASGSKDGGKPDKTTNSSPANSGNDPDAIDIGDALRSAYEDAVKEDIPAEMIDLLGKLD